MRLDVDVVFFDAGGTMTFPRPADVAAAVGIDTLAEPSFFEAFYRTVRALEDLPALDSRDVGRWWWSRWLAEAGVPDEAIEQSLDVITSGTALQWVHRRDGVVETLEGLCASGVRLAVISNAHGRVADELREVGVAHYFETIVDSHLVGVEKPDPRIFEIALERMDVTPDRAAHVGDVYSIDVVGARSVGITPVHLDPLCQYDHDELRIARLPDLLEFLA